MRRRWTAARAMVITTAALMMCARVTAGQGTVAISNGIALLARRDIAGARREFERAARDSSPALRSAGEQWLGHLSWMLDADAKSASAHLDRALVGAPDRSSILVERARLLGFERRYREATRTAVEAMHHAVDGERRGVAARTAVDAAVDGAFAAIAERKSVADSVDALVTREALDTLAGRVDRFPGRTNDALAMLNAGVLLRDRDAIVGAWKSYFALAIRDSERLSSADIPSAMTARSKAIDRTRVTESEPVADLLAKYRLYESAALLLASERPAATRVARFADIASYGSFLHQLRVATNEYYRRALRGLAKEGDLDRVINAETRSLWRRLHWPAGVPRYYPAAVPGELARRFNAVMLIEHDATIAELQLAHAVDAFVAPPSINSGRAKQRMVVLDAPVSNGVAYWLLDGASGRAGWVSGFTIYQLRTAFTETPFRTWISLTDPQLVPGELFRIQRDSAADIARARADSAGYLPGVAARMFRAGASAILDSVGRLSLPYVDEERAFVGALFHELTATTITLHEARHLSDARIPGRSGSSIDAEFRAKIDEVALASRPKLAMSAILHPNIGDASPHGQANRRIMLGLIRWIRAHGSDIVGFDRSAPPLVQLPLLTDAQLRAAFQGMRSID